jgi:hypothetical protein
MLMSYVLRGEEVDIEITDRREPYEWLIVGKTPAEHDAMMLTDAEEADIYQAIATTLYERAATASYDD